MSPHVTVVIDTYNCGHLVHRAIESVLSGTYPLTSLDILVIDDGSTDNTRTVVERYAPRVRYLYKSNGGQGSALNEGFRHALGDIVCLLDGDDYFYPRKVQRVVEVFDRFPSVGLVYHQFDVVGRDGEMLEHAVPPTIPEGKLAGHTLLGYSTGCVTSALSVRRSVVQGITIPETAFRVSADYFLGNILPLLTEVGAIHETLSAWVSHGANSLLSNPAGSSAELNEMHRAAILQYAQNHLDARFVTYLGRAGMGENIVHPNGISGRVVAWLQDTERIVLADVDIRLKLRAVAKLTAAFLPAKLFARMRKF